MGAAELRTQKVGLSPFDRIARIWILGTIFISISMRYSISQNQFRFADLLA